jgi:hypothetical protein
MGWRDHLQKEEETVVLPWFAGREIRSADRVFNIQGKLPREPGWNTFSVKGRTARLLEGEEAKLRAEQNVLPPGSLQSEVSGYLVGDRFIRDDAVVDPDPARIAEQSEQIWFVEEGLDRFTRVEAGRVHEGGPLIFAGMAFPLGPEDEVTRAFQDRKPSVSDIKGVVPALDAAFRMESWRRSETERLRAEAEERRRREEEQRRREEQRQELVRQLGDGAGRRAMAAVDFDAAARAALQVGGAEFLDARQSRNRNEMVVTFRFHNRRFECTCDRFTLQIIDAGICLVNHATGEKGDAYFTLESFPAVIAQAERERRLVVWRHVDGVDDRDREDWDD